VIDRIEGTAATLTPGHTYTVTGHYTLSSCDEAVLHVYATNGETQSKQGPAVKRGSGRFTRTFKFVEDGYPHLSYYPAGGGSGFGGIYFKNPDGPTLGGRPERDKALRRPRQTDASARTNVAVKDMKVLPYEGGLFQVVASILNTSDVPVGPFRVYFYVNDPGKQHPKNHGAGPIEPGKEWNEGTMPFLLNEGFNTIEVALDSKYEIQELSETDNSFMLLVNVKNGQIIQVVRGQIQGDKTPPGDTRANAGPKTNINVKNLMAHPREGGLFQIGASIFNTSETPVGQFSVYFYVNDPDKLHPMRHAAGPIQPRGRWNEGTRPLALREGYNTLEIVIDSDNKIGELNEADNEMMIRAEVKDGQVSGVIVLTR